MIPFVTKLLMSGQLKFDQGQMSIFDQRVLIFPLEMVKIIIEKSMKDKDFSKSIYEAAKQSVASFSKNVSHRLNIKKQKDMLNILVSLTEMNGYGKINVVKVDYKNKTAVLHLRGLPSRSMFKKFKNLETADVYWCGLVAGGMTYVFGENVEAVETRCVVSGKESCEIVAGEKSYLEAQLKKNNIPKPFYLK